MSYMHYSCLSQCIWDWPRRFCKCGNIYQYQIALRKTLSTEALHHGLKDLPEMKPKNLSQRPLESMEHHELMLMQM